MICLLSPRLSHFVHGNGQPLDLLEQSHVLREDDHLHLDFRLEILRLLFPRTARYLY